MSEVNEKKIAIFFYIHEVLGNKGHEGVREILESNKH